MTLWCGWKQSNDTIGSGKKGKCGNCCRSHHECRCGIAGALTTALWGGFGRNNGYYFAMIITAAAAGAITILQAVFDNILGVQHVSFLRAAS